MDPDVIQDPVFQQLLTAFERINRKFRDAVIAMRSFYLTHHKAPIDESASEKWRGALLAEDASQKFQDVESAAADLLRYAYEICPNNSSPIHLEELMKLKLAHRKRLEERTGWGTGECGPKGIEEQTLIDDGPPVTIVFRPEAYEFTDRARRKKPAK
jgi:hypothetical protein